MFNFFSKTDTHIFRLLKILLGACLMTPLLAWAGVIFPYTAPKAFAFRILVEIAAVLYFYLALKSPDFRFSFLSCHCETPLMRGRSNPADSGNISGLPRRPAATGLLATTFVVLFFLFASFLSAIFGLDFNNSFWGNLERMSGIWGLAHLVAWFLMLSAVFKTKEDWFLLMKVSVVTGAVVAVSALVQRIGGLGGLLPPADRIYGLIGNAGIFASYIIFNIFFAGYLFFVSSGKAKWLFAISSLLLVLSLFLSGTRGTILGLSAGVIVFLFLWATKNLLGNKKILTPLAPLYKGGQNSPPPCAKGGWGVKIPAIILVAIFIFAGSLFLARNSALIKNNPTLSRLTSFSLSDVTIQSRLILWQSSWQAWQERPVLGFGPENFSMAADKYFDARLAQYEAYTFDRAHNFIFDYGVETGWLGLLSYLMMIVAAGRALWLKRKDDFIFFAILISLFTAYLVQNFFIFDSFVSYLMLFFVLAVPLPTLPDVERKGLCPVGTRAKRPGNIGTGSVSLGLLKKMVFLSAVICLLLSLYSFNLKPLYAAYLANQILSLPASNAAQATPLLKDVLGLDTFASPEIAYQVTLDYIDKIGRAPALAQNEEFYTIASAWLLETINRSPGQSRNYIALAWLDLYFSNKDAQRINDALILGDKILELNPIKKDAYLILVAGYALNNQPAKAEEIISQASAIDGRMGEEVKQYWEKLK